MPACRTVGSAAFIQHCCPIATFSRLPILDREINEAFSKRNGTGTSGQTVGQGLAHGWRCPRARRAAIRPPRFGSIAASHLIGELGVAQGGSVRPGSL
jgi:hypothetical protein